MMKKFNYKLILSLLFSLSFMYSNYNSSAQQLDNGININQIYDSNSEIHYYGKSFGVLRYDYKSCQSNDYSKYIVSNGNLGDYIQSIAAEQYITPKYSNKILINRDTLKYYNGLPVDMIMNGWYFINEKNEVFSDKINPIFVSFHINNINEVNDNTINYLKSHEPIGCRDHCTEKFLLSKGVKSYFSGCLTTTLDIKYKVSDSMRNNDIIFCDYNFGYNNEIDQKLRNTLSAYDLSNISFTTHYISKNTSHFKRFKMADDVLNKYAKAKLVVTTRLHCALPCLAMGTPVIFVNSDYDSLRFDGLYEMLNTIGMDKQGNISTRVNLDSNNKVINSDSYLLLANELKSYISTYLK